MVHLLILVPISFIAYGTYDIFMTSVSIRKYTDCYRLDAIVKILIAHNICIKRHELISDVTLLIAKARMQKNGLLYKKIEKEFGDILEPIIECGMNNHRVEDVIAIAETNLQERKRLIKKLLRRPIYR